MNFDNESPAEFHRRQAAFWADHPRRQRSERRRGGTVKFVASLLVVLGYAGTNPLLKNYVEYELSTLESFALGVVLAVASFMAVDRVIPKAK
jgi:hypothetical protein